MLLKLLDLSLELNLSHKWSTKLREWERRKGEISLCFEGATKWEEMCSIRVVPSETKETTTYDQNFRSKQIWPLETKQIWPLWRLGPTRTSGQRPEVNPDTRGHAQRLLCGLLFMDQNFRLWTETSGHGPELSVNHRKCFLKRERTSHSPTETSYQADWNFRSYILTTISNLLRWLTFSSELRIRWSWTFWKAYSEGYTIHMDNQSKSKWIKVVFQPLSHSNV